MLKGIPAILSPELLKVLSEMGHGDRLVIAASEDAEAVTERGIRDGDRSRCERAAEEFTPADSPRDCRVVRGCVGFCHRSCPPQIVGVVSMRG